MNKPLIQDKKYLSDRRRMAWAIGFVLLLAISIAVILYVIGARTVVVQVDTDPSPSPTITTSPSPSPSSSPVGADINVPTTTPISGTSAPQTPQGLPKQTSATPTPAPTPPPSQSQTGNGILEVIGRGLQRLLSTL